MNSLALHQYQNVFGEHITNEEIICFLNKIAATSDDPDTQTACVTVNAGSNELIVLAAANKFPDGIRITPERLERPAKYDYIVHAERRLICMAARAGIELAGCTLWLNWFPCAPCAGMLVEAGVVTLYADRDKYESRKDDPRYGFAAARAILAEGGVEIKWIGEA